MNIESHKRKMRTRLQRRFPDGLIPSNAAAKELNITTFTLSRKKELPRIKRGKQCFYSVDDIINYAIAS